MDKQIFQNLKNNMAFHIMKSKNLSELAENLGIIANQLDVKIKESEKYIRDLGGNK